MKLLKVVIVATLFFSAIVYCQSDYEETGSTGGLSDYPDEPEIEEYTEPGGERGSATLAADQGDEDDGLGFDDVVGRDEEPEERSRGSRDSAGDSADDEGDAGDSRSRSSNDDEDSSDTPPSRSSGRSSSRSSSRSSNDSSKQSDDDDDDESDQSSSRSSSRRTSGGATLDNKAWDIDGSKKASVDNKTCTAYDEIADGSEYPFYFGYSSSAYQYEGGALRDGRLPSVWDTFSKWSGKVTNDDNGDEAVDFYNKYKEDIKLLKTLGVKNFRISISWSRVSPNGNGTINARGLKFYRDLIDALKEACIEPHVTLYHWDLPFALQTKYKGWVSEDIIDDFATYAEEMFKAFGDRVKHWISFNQPYTFCMLGYGWGVHAPGRCTGCIGGGNTEIEPYKCSSNVVRAHARAADVFKKHVPDGDLTMALNLDWVEAYDASNDTDVDSVNRHLDLAFRMFADPIYKGRYPKALRDIVPSVPRLTTEEIRMLMRNKPKYFAVNHYTSYFIKYDFWTPPPIQYQQVKTSKNGTRLGPSGDSSWLTVWPRGIRRMLNWIADEYEDPEIIIYENGCSVKKEATADYPDLLNDQDRMEYFKAYLDEVKKAVEFDDVSVKGYFAWTLLDAFEWSDGYTKKFGTVFVNMTSLERKPKNSAFWLSRKFNILPDDVPYQKRLFLQTEEMLERQRKEEEKEKQKDIKAQEQKKKLGDFAPIKLSDLVEQMDDVPPEQDPATNPFNGGRKR